MKRLGILAISFVLFVGCNGAPFIATNDVQSEAVNLPGIYSDVVCDGSGVYVTGLDKSPDGDVFIKALNTAGKPLWSKTFDTNSSTTPKVAIDSSANVYVTGKYSLSGTNKGLFLRKLNSKGDLLWLVTFAKNGDEQLRDVEVDSLGSIYILSQANEPDASTGGLIIYHNIRKFDATGKQIQTFVANRGLALGASEAYQFANSIKIDKANNHYCQTLGGEKPSPSGEGFSECFEV
jgi:hypothetical protein